MLNVILWGTGNELNSKINLIKFYEKDGKINVLGITSRIVGIRSVYGYSFIEKDEVKKLDFDVIIIVSNRFCDEITNEIINMGIDRRMIWNSEVLSIPNFDFEKYKSLKYEPVTLFSQNCWGGGVLHSLSLRFMSPLVNMWLSDNDIIKFLKKPKYYIEHEIVFFKYIWDESRRCYYPVGKCDDICFYFLHYFDFEEALVTFKKRSKRINWSNIAVEMATADRNIINQFLELPYGKKICFVPYYIEEQECIRIDFDKSKDGNMLAASMHFTNGFLDTLSWLYDGSIKLIKEYRD